MNFATPKEKLCKAASMLNHAGNNFPQTADFRNIDAVASLINFLVVFSGVRRLLEDAEIDVLRQFDEANEKYQADR
jgi:hypothetical protein